MIFYNGVDFLRRFLFFKGENMNEKIIISKNNVSKTNNGVFEGWGTSLCWWAHRIGFSKKLIDDSARLFFSAEGLNLNIMRYNIGGGDNPTHNHIERTDSEIPGWLKLNENGEPYYDYEADKKQIDVMLAAHKAAGKDAFVEAFSNSPPYFMTVSGCSSGSKSAIATNIKKSCVSDFADYLATVVKYLKETYSLSVKSLACMNEPFTNYWRAYSPKQEGCHVSPGKMQSLLLCETAKALKKHKIEGVTVTATDETDTKLQLKAFNKLSSEALSVVGRISTHTYSKATPKIGTVAREKGFNLWMSETDWSSVSGENPDEMGPALWLCEKIIEDINTLSPSAWVIWQIVASYISKDPDEKGRYDLPCLPDLTKGFWGTAFADIDKEEIYLTQKYYAFGQFSRYIRPGMTIIHSGKKFLCAYDSENQQVIALFLNTKQAEKEITIDLKDFCKDFSVCTPIRTSGSLKNGEHWKELSKIPLKSNRFSATLKGNSITTFVIK